MENHLPQSGRLQIRCFNAFPLGVTPSVTPSVRLSRTLRSICYEYSMPKSHFRIPAYDGPLHRRIRLLVKANPKRGKAALRFAKYRDGMTVEEYIRACEDVGTPNYAIFDITWDTDPKRKFIELYD